MRHTIGLAKRKITAAKSMGSKNDQSFRKKIELVNLKKTGLDAFI
jgi:hypothetical protein